MIENIKKNAELVIERLQSNTEFEFGYNEESVAWLAQFIENQRLRPEFSLEKVDGLTNTLGSYLGECIIFSFGGAWKLTDYGWCVEFSEGNAVYPFNKVKKQFENGLDDSVLSFFISIKVIFGGPQNNT